MTLSTIQMPVIEVAKKYENIKRDASIPIAARYQKQAKRPKEEGKGDMVDVLA